MPNQQPREVRCCPLRNVRESLAQAGQLFTAVVVMDLRERLFGNFFMQHLLPRTSSLTEAIIAGGGAVVDPDSMAL